jgi:ubiquinone biosynthesis protein
MLRRVVALIQRIQKRIDLRALVTEVTRFIELELDFRREVRATERLASTLADFPGVVVPRVHRELCGERTIVLEYLDGIQVTRTEALVAAGHKLSEVARKVGALYGSMIFEHGFFHGDPHPGNLLVLGDGRIGLLDFGLAKELPPGFAASIARMFGAALAGDAEAAVTAARRLGFGLEGIEPAAFLRVLGLALGAKHGIAEALAIANRGLAGAIPEDIALVIRTLILLNGLSERLAPGERRISRELLAGAASAFRPASA